jgi:hypothetical protein
LSCIRQIIFILKIQIKNKKGKKQLIVNISMAFNKMTFLNMRLQEQIGEGYLVVYIFYRAYAALKKPSFTIVWNVKYRLTY